MARPNLSYLKNAFLILIGLPLGIATGMTGASTSAIAVPLLGFLIGQRGPRAVSTALAMNAVAAAASLLAYSQHHYLAVWPSILLLVTQVLGIGQGQRLRGTGKPPPVWMGALLMVAIGVAMAFVGVSKHVTIHGVDDLNNPPGPFPHLRLAQYVVIGVAGLVVGVLSQYLDLGGLLAVPALVFGLPFAPHWAQGLALVSLAVTGIPVALAHASSGLLDTRSTQWLSCGALFGALVGAMYATTHYNGGILLVIYGGLLCVVGIVRYMQTDPPPTPAS